MMKREGDSPTPSKPAELRAPAGLLRSTVPVSLFKLDMLEKTIMENRMTLSILLTLSLLLSLASFPSMALGQQPAGRFSASSGAITLGAGQGLRVSAVNNDGRAIRVRFAWTQYMAADCSGTPVVCRHTVASQGTTTPETLATDDALIFDLPASGGGVNVTVQSNSRNTKVLGVVFDTSTQRVVAICTFIPD
jgi:hypothetical protein